MSKKATPQGDERQGVIRESASGDSRAGDASTGGLINGSEGAGDPEGAADEERDSRIHLRLRRIKLNKWRNVLPGTELRFGDGVHALLGKNGTGKTTLLRLISMCVRNDFSAVESEDFDIEYDIDLGRYKAFVSVANETTSLDPAEEQMTTLGPHRGDRRALAEPSYRIRIVLHGLVDAPVELESTRTKLWLNGEPREPQERGLLSPFKGALWSQVDNALRLSVRRAGRSPITADLEGQVSSGATSLYVDTVFMSFSAFRFDEADGLLDALEGLTAKPRSELPLLDIHLWAIPIFDPWVPDELETFCRRWLKEQHSVTELRPTSADLPFLQTFAGLAGFDEVTMVLPLQAKTKSSASFGKASFLIQLKNGDLITQELLSFGQRRLLAFLYYAACNPDTLIVDELTNGLHHEWIEACVDELEKRQSFVATQNPLLIDYLPVASSQDAETAFLQCRLVEKDGKQWMDWRNTTPDEAERFWKSYETGVQFISEILRTEGLW